jgi:hypothetical protein
VDHRRHARHGPHGAVEAELADERETLEPRRRYGLGGDRDADREGDVERGSGLALMRRREVDGDLLRRPGDVAGHDRGADPIP